MATRIVCGFCQRAVKQAEKLRSCSAGCGNFLHRSCLPETEDASELPRCSKCAGAALQTSTEPISTLLARILFLTDLVVEMRDDLSDARAEIRLLKTERSMMPVNSTPTTPQNPFIFRSSTILHRSAASPTRQQQYQPSTASSTNSRKRSADLAIHKKSKFSRTDLENDPDSKTTGNHFRTPKNKTESAEMQDGKP